MRDKELESFMAVPAEVDLLMERITSEMNLQMALTKVVQDKGTPVVDGRSVKEVEQDHATLVPQLRRELLSGSYRPVEVRRVWLPKPGRFTRSSRTLFGGIGLGTVPLPVALQFLDPLYRIQCTI